MVSINFDFVLFVGLVGFFWLLFHFSVMAGSIVLAALVLFALCGIPQFARDRHTYDIPLEREKGE